MIRHHPMRLAACALALSVPQEAREALSSIINPAPNTVATAAATEDMLKEVEELLWRYPDEGTLWYLGEAAVPALEELTRSCSLERLINDSSLKSPFFWLSEISPTDALAAQVRLSKSHPERFRLLIRRGLGPFGIDEVHLDGANVAKAWEQPDPELMGLAHSFLEAVLKDAELPLDQKLSVCCAAHELGVATKETVELIRGNLERAAPFLMRVNLTEFVLGGRSELPTDLPEPLALRALGGLAPSIAVPPLTSSPHARVRERAFKMASAKEFDQGVAIGLFLARPVEIDPEVRAAMMRVMSRHGTGAEGALSVETLVPLVEFAVRYKAQGKSLALSIADAASRLIIEARPDDVQSVRKLVHALYAEDFPELQSRILVGSIPRDIRSVAIAQAIVDGASGTVACPDLLIEEIAAKWADSYRAGTDPALSSLLWSTYAYFEPADHKQALPRKPTYLAALPPDLAPDALAWLGRSSTRYDAIASVSPGHWTGAFEALRASAFDESRPWRERCIATIALLHQPAPTDADVDRITAVLTKELEEAGRRRSFFNLLNDSLAGGSAPLSSAWSIVVERLFASPTTSDETTSWLELGHPVRTDTGREVLSRILVLAAGRLDPKSHSTQSRQLIAVAVEEELRNWSSAGRLIPDNLLAHWIEHELPFDNGYRGELMKVVLLREDPALAARALAPLVQQLRLASTRTARVSLVSAILQLPGETPEMAVISLATQYLDTQTRIDAFRKIRARHEAQRFQAELLAQDRAAAPTRESALAEVLLLLDDDQESVRIEAIRGLGTLSAVEALPRLIAIVGSGSEKERAEARETLDLLRRMAQSK